MQTNNCNNEITVVLCQRAGKAKKKKERKKSKTRKDGSTKYARNGTKTYLLKKQVCIPIELRGGVRLALAEVLCKAQ